MALKYEGALARIEEQNSVAIFSPCGCHTLYLCGSVAAARLPEPVTYLCTVQTIHNSYIDYVITCSAFTRNDGNYLRYELVVIYMACKKPGGLREFN